MAGYDIFHNYGFTQPTTKQRVHKKLTEDVDHNYYGSLIHKQDKEIQTLQQKYNQGDKSPSDICLELGYQQDESNEHMFKKQTGSYTCVIDFFDFDQWDDPIVYYVLDPSGRIPQGYCRTRYKLQEPNNTSWMNEGIDMPEKPVGPSAKEILNRGLSDVYCIDCDDDQSYNDRL